MGWFVEGVGGVRGREEGSSQVSLLASGIWLVFRSVQEVVDDKGDNT